MAAGMAAALPVVFCFGVLMAQAPEAPQPLKSSVETVAAEVEVLVLDAKGVPIEGLTKDDFKLLVNGKEAPIDFFEAPPVSSVPETGVPGRAAEGASPVPVPPRRAHSTVFVISDLHVDLRSRNTALEALKAYAERLPAGEPAAVYLLDNGVRRLLGFTTDRRALRKALESPLRRLPRSYVFTETHGVEWVGQSRQMLRNFTTILDGLSSRPEPKTVIVVTGPMSPTGPVAPIGGDAAAAARSSALGDPHTGVFATRGFWTFLQEVRDSEDQALLARATVVALDPAGLGSPDANTEINSISSAAGMGRRELSGPSRLRPADATSESDPTRTDSWEYRNDTFALLAESTGGSRLGFSNEPVRLLADETRRLARRYRLGFTPPDGTSARRAIRVAVARPGAVVRTAGGQRSQTAGSAARARFAGLLLGAEEPKGDFAIGVEMKGPVKNRADDTLPFDLLVPVTGVFAEERADGKVAKLELLIAGVDDEGRSSALTVIPFTVALDNGASDGAFFRKDAHFELDHRWKGRLFIGVRDTATNRLGAVAVPIGT